MPVACHSLEQIAAQGARDTGMESMRVEDALRRVEVARARARPAGLMRSPQADRMSSALRALNSDGTASLANSDICI